MFSLFATYIALIRVLKLCFKKFDKADWYDKVLKVEKQIFYNFFIQYLIVEAMKLNLACMVALKASKNEW